MVTTQPVTYCHTSLASGPYLFYIYSVTCMFPSFAARWQSEILNIFVNRSVPYDHLMTSSQAGSRPPMSAFSLVLVVGLVSTFCVCVILFVAALAIVKQKQIRRTRQQNGNHVPIPTSDFNDALPVVKATLSNHETPIDDVKYDNQARAFVEKIWHLSASFYWHIMWMFSFVFSKS